MKQIFLSIAILLAGITANQAQNTFPSTGAAGIGTTSPNASSLLEINSVTKGFLAPRMTRVQRTAIPSPAIGLLVYQTDGSYGFYYYYGSGWTRLLGSGATQTLSNLLAPVAINQSLLPGTTATIDLGSSTKQWRDAYFSGSVGIGTTSPSFSLDVLNNSSTFGQFKSTSGYAGVILDKSSTNLNEYVIHRTAGIDKWTEGTIGSDNFSLRNWSLGTDALFVDISNNNVGIGTSLPDKRLVVTSAAVPNADATAIIQNLSGNSFSDGLYIQAGSNTGGGSWYNAFRRPDGAVIGTVAQATATSVSYNTTSDKRLKTNIHETKFGLADVKKIQVKDYIYIDEKTEQTGFIAQQLYEVFPEAVAVGGADPKKRPWMVDYGRVTPLLVKAIQDLSVKNDEKDATITSMQQQINSLAEELKSLKAMIKNGTNDASIKSGYLKQNIPNPSNNNTVISYYVPNDAGRAEIIITDAKGSSIKTYTATKGAGQLSIKSGELPVGVYNYTLYANNKVIDTKQMVVVK